jgi:hypothetical protein
MRSIIVFFLSVLTCLLFACNNDEKNAAVQTPAVDSLYIKDSIALVAVIDSLHNAFKEKSIDRMNNFFAEDGLFIGTDPAEFWTREGLNSYLQPSFQKDSMPSAYTVSKRAIKMTADREAAVVVDQFALPFSPKLPVRSIAFAEYSGSRWQIKMFSWSFVANNADVDKLNNTLK